MKSKTIVTKVILVMILGLLTAVSVQAAPPDQSLYATCTVETTANSGAGSLRFCLQNAGTGDTIDFDTGIFPPGSPATIFYKTNCPTFSTTT